MFWLRRVREFVMNRYRVHGKLLVHDVIEIGNLNSVVVTNPKPYTDKLTTATNPAADPQVHIDYEYPDPQTLPVPPEEPIPFRLEFDAPDIDKALEWGSDEIEARADVLAYLTLNNVEVQIDSCEEITPGKRQVQQIFEGSMHPEPVVLRSDFFANVMHGTILEGRLSSKVLGSFRWFRKGLEYKKLPRMRLSTIGLRLK